LHLRFCNKFLLSLVYEENLLLKNVNLRNEALVVAFTAINNISTHQKCLEKKKEHMITQIRENKNINKRLS
jgi:hypothetical protein